MFSEYLRSCSGSGSAPALLQRGSVTARLSESVCELAGYAVSVPRSSALEFIPGPLACSVCRWSSACLPARKRVLEASDGLVWSVGGARGSLGTTDALSPCGAGKVRFLPRHDKNFLLPFVTTCLIFP